MLVLLEPGLKKLYINTPNSPGVSAFGSVHEPWPNDTTKYKIAYDQACQQITKKEFSNSDLEKLTEFSASGDTIISRTIEYRFDGEESKISFTKKLDSIREMVLHFSAYQEIQATNQRI